MLSKNTIKYLTSLQLKKKRHEHSVYVIEGEKTVLEAMRWKKNEIRQLFCTNAFKEEQNLSDFSYEIITEQELKQISSLSTPNKVLATLQIEDTSIDTSDFYLALDGIQDPGNMGTIIRLADWFGLNQLICSTDCVDCFNPKVVQATMGSLFRVQIHYVNLNDFLSKQSLPVYGAMLNGANVYQQSLSRKGILLMGNEGNGIRKELLPLITYPLTIPRFGHAESLNVSMATSILLSEFSRSF